jgi:hypothetical protein
MKRVKRWHYMTRLRRVNEAVMAKGKIPVGYDIKYGQGTYTAVLDEPSLHPVGPARLNAIEAIVDAWAAALRQAKK